MKFFPRTSKDGERALVPLGVINCERADRARARGSLRRRAASYAVLERVRFFLRRSLLAERLIDAIRATTDPRLIIVAWIIIDASWLSRVPRGYDRLHVASERESAIFTFHRAAATRSDINPLRTLCARVQTVI